MIQNSPIAAASQTQSGFAADAMSSANRHVNTAKMDSVSEMKTQ
jgi:hypothetical protein